MKVCYAVERLCARCRVKTIELRCPECNGKTRGRFH